MNPFNKLLLIPLVALAIGGGVGIAAATNGGSAGDPANPPATDVKGPCDELEHATDPQCNGAVLMPGDTTTGAAEPGDDNGQDQNDPAEVEDQNDDNGQVQDDQGQNADDQGENDDDQGQSGDDQGENEQEDNSGPSADSGTGSSRENGDDNASDDGGHSGHDGGDDNGSD
jgi:hypothetical protein